MVGRNEKCPCGSGKKYKACCIDKVINFPNTLSLPKEDIPGSFFTSKDPKYDQVKNDLRELYPFEKKNPQFLNEISVNLGLLGNPQDGLLYAKKALKHCGKRDTALKYALLTNLAAMSAEVGDHSTGLKYLTLVPDGFSRKSVIEANVRREIEPFENVTHLYEKAIEEEPNFFLPYEHLISRLDHEDSKRDFLIDKAFKEMPENPRAALYWADKELMNRNFAVLGDEAWINKVRNFDLKNSPEQTTINFSAEFPKAIGALELIHELSRVTKSLSEKVSYKSVLKSHSENIIEIPHNLEQLSKTCLPKIEKQFRCGVSRKLIDFAISFGLPEKFEFYTDHLCDGCKEHFPVNQLKFSSMFRKVRIIQKLNSVPDGDLIESTLQVANKVLEDQEQLEEDFVNSLFDFLDDEVSSDMVLEYAKTIFQNDTDRVTFTNKYEEYRLFWNLAIVAGKANLWGLSRHFFEKISTFDIQDTLDAMSDELSDMGEFEEVLVDNRSLLELYLSLTHLAEKNISSAETELSRVADDPVMGIAFAKDIELIRSLIKWVSNHSESITFKNDFRNQLKQIGLEFWIGQKPKIKNPENSLSDIFSLYSRTDVNSQIRLHQTMAYQAALDSKDLSEVVNSLEEIIPNFRILPDNAKKSLISAETYKFNAKTQFDCSPSIMSFCKALEIYMKNEIFEKFAKNIRSSGKLEEYILVASNDAKVVQFRSLITFLKTGYLELGSAAQCLKLCSGKSAERIELLKELKSYLLNCFPVLMDVETVKNIQHLSKTFRNPAVHEKNFGIEDLTEVRHITSVILNSIIGQRLIEKVDR